MVVYLDNPSDKKSNVYLLRDYWFSRVIDRPFISEMGNPNFVKRNLNR